MMNAVRPSFIVNSNSCLLNCCNTGCVSGDTIINHLMYADDLVLISPSATEMK